MATICGLSCFCHAVINLSSRREIDRFFALALPGKEWQDLLSG